MESIWSQPPGRGAVARARKLTSLAEIREVERAPFRTLLPRWSILGMIEEHAASFPAKTALIVADQEDPTAERRRVSYAELAAAIRATANRLRAVSADAPPVVSILTPLLAESLIASWAGAAAGVANPINPFLRIDHVANIMNAAGTTVLVCGTRSDGPGAWQDVDKLRGLVPSLRAVWYADQSGSPDSFWSQISKASHDRLAFEPDPLAGRTAALVHTGGTTASPKLVQQTEQGTLLNAWCCGTINNYGTDEVLALGMPYFHVGGSTCIAVAGMVFGQAVVIVSPDGYRSPAVINRFWDMVDAHRLSATVAAPTTAAALVACKSGRRPSQAFNFWSGGATVPIQVAREFRQKFGMPLHEGWGMTELQGGLILNPKGVEPRLGSIGLPYPYHRTRCVAHGSRSADVEAPHGTVGVLAISGPCVSPGYLDPSRNADLFLETSVPGERWLNTGDLCTIDGNGYVWLRGRSKDLIIRGAHNIDPLMIEDALLKHPAVMYAAAIGEPDRDKGEMPVAYVQLRAGLTASEAELAEHCRSEITERAAVPRTVRILDTMPVTAVGKIFKPALRLDAVRQCVEGVANRLEDNVKPEVTVREIGGTISVVLAAAGASDSSLERIRRELEHYTFRVEIAGAAPEATP